MRNGKKILLIYGPRLDVFDNTPKFLTKTFLSEINSRVEYENTILISEDFSLPVFDFLQKYSLGEFETEILVVDNVIDILKTWKSVRKEVFKNIPPIYSRIVKGVIFIYDVSEETRIAEFHLTVNNDAAEKMRKERKDDDGDDVKFPHPYIFKPPNSPEDFGNASQIQVHAPSKEKDFEDENYCQYCGKNLSKEEQLTHSCKKKPK